MSENIKALVNLEGVTAEMEVIKRQNGFDGETGEPVFEYVCRNGFDGETGEPVYVSLVSDGFDGETGQPVFKEAQHKNVFEDIAKEISSPKDFDKKKVLPLIIAGAAVLTVIIVVAAGFLSGAFLSKRNKVALATYKTINASTFGKLLVDGASVLSSDKITTDINADATVEGYSADINASVAINSKKSLVGVDAKVDVAGLIDQSAEIYFDDSMIAASLPDISKAVYCYDYSSDGDGFIAELVEDETRGDISDVNTAISCLSDIMKKSAAGKNAMKKAIMKAYRQVEVSKIGSEEFEVNEKDRRCKGYEMTITGDNLAYLLTEVADAQDVVYGDTIEILMEAIASLSGEDLSEFNLSDEDSLDEITEEFIDMDDIVIDFYLYKGMLAAVETEIERTRITIEFQGGDNRCSNVALTLRRGSNSRTSVKLKSEMNDGTEDGSVYVDKASILTYKYNTKTGKFTVTVPFAGDVKGTLKVGKHEIKASSDISAGRVSGSFEFAIKDKAQISKPRGSYEDIGEADEDELEEMAQDIMDEINPMSELPYAEPAPGFEDDYFDYYDDYNEYENIINDLF